MMHKPLGRLRNVEESRPPWVTVKPSRPNYGTEDPFVVLSGHPPPPGGTFYFPLSRHRSTASNSSFLMYPLVAPFSHSYTSSNTGSVPFPRGSGLASQSRTQSLQASSGRGAPTAPAAGSACSSCDAGAAAIRAGSALQFGTAGAAAVRAGSAGPGLCGASQCGGAWRRGSRGGWGGISFHLC